MMNFDGISFGHRVSSRLDTLNPLVREMDFDWLILAPYAGLQTIFLTGYCHPKFNQSRLTNQDDGNAQTILLFEQA